MRTIEATVTIGTDGKLVLQLPPDIGPGERRVVVVIEEPPASKPERPPLEFPVIDVGPWPDDLSLRREDMYGDWGR